MKIAKSFLKIAAPVILLVSLGLSKVNAQNVSYTAKNTATATGNVGTVTLTDVSNNGTTVIRDNFDQTPVNFPMIGVAKQASVSAIQSDGSYNVTYTIRVQNFGAIALKTVQVTDDLATLFPSPMTFTKTSLVKTGTGGAIVNAGFNGGTDKNLLNSATSVLAVGANNTLTLILNVKPNGNFGNFDNTATATGVTNNTDAVTVTDLSTDNSIPNHSTATKTPLDFNDPTRITLSPPDLQVVKLVDNATPNVNTNVTFTITVTNVGTGTAAPVVLDDVLPAGYQYVSNTPSAGTYDNTTGKWTIGTLIPGAGNAVTLAVVAKVLPNQVGHYANTASITYPGDPVTTNNTSTPTVTPVQLADLSITNTDGVTSYAPGTTHTYTVVVTNAGPSDVTGATVANTLPTGSSWTAVYAGGATGNASGTNSISESVNIPTSGTVTYTVTVPIPSGQTGNFVSTATVTAPASVTDGTPANNTATDTDIPTADLSITNTDGKGNYVPGQNNVYTVVVSNTGPANVTGATVTNTLPAGSTWTAVYAGGATGNASGSNSINETVNIPKTGTVTYTVTVPVPAGQVGNFTSTANVAPPATVDDPTPANNTATDTDIPTTDLSITNTDGKAAYVPGTSNTYTVVVTNNGPAAVTVATVASTLPAGATWTAAYAGGATGGASGTGTISESVNMPVSSTVTYTVVVPVPSNQTGHFITTATVTAPVTVFESNTANNTASDDDVPSADLKITNTDGVTTYTPGAPSTYTIVATNSGPADVSGATIANTLPAGVTGTWTAVYAGGATGNASGSGSIAETVNMSSGSTVTYTYVVTTPSGNTGNFTTTATIALPVGVPFTDPTPANNTATDVDTRDPKADLSITNTDGTPTYTPGTTTTYTVVASNNGPTDAPGSTVTNPLPTGTTGTWTAVYAGGATGAASGTGSINQTIDIPKGGTVTYTVVVAVPGNITGNLVSTATVAVPAGYTDPTPANNTATDTDTMDPKADLSITNTDGKTTYTPGTTNTYTIVVNNAGPTDAPGSTVTNTLPAGVTGTWTAVYTGGATGNASGTNSIAETVNIPKGGTITYTYVVTIPSNVTGSFTNTATVTIPTGFTDPTPANNTAADVDAIAPVADLAITNTDGTPTYTPGTTTTYTVVATNTGPTDAPGSKVTNPLPTGTTGTWTAVYAGGATGNASGTGGINENVDIPKGGTVTYTVVVTVPSSATGNLVSTATVAVPAGYTDPTPANNTATDTDTRNPIADLAITNTDGTPTYTPGTTTTYTVVATNTGPTDAPGSKVTNPLPAGTTGTWTAIYTGGATGNANGTGGINENVDIPKGGTVTYTVVVTVPSSATGNLVSTATVAVPVGYTDPTPANNTATDTDTRNPIADLAITNTDGVTTYTPGTTTTYTIVASNGGPTDAPGSKVTNPLPAGTTGTWTAVYAGGATGNASGTGSINENVDIPKGGTVTYTVVVTVPSSITGNLVSTATVAVPAGYTDPTPANNVAVDTDLINPIADLSITNTDGKTTYTPGTTNTYTVVVTNGGPTDVPGAKVTNTLPAGVTGTWTAVYAGGATGLASGTNSIAETVNMPKGSTITYTYVVTIPSNVTSDFTNTATVALPSGLGFTDPTPANNTATDVDTFTPIADLSITNTDGKTTYTPGTTNTYTVVVSNGGPTDVPGAVVTNILPAGVTGTWTAVYGGGSSGAVSGTNSINEAVNMPAGSKVTYTYVVTIPSNVTGNFTNTANVALPTGLGFTDPTPANNTATDVDTFTPVADLSITNIDGTPTYTPGTTTTYTIVASNNGPTDAPGSTVTNPLPAGTTGTWTAVYSGGASGTANGTGSINQNVNIPSGGKVTYTVVVTVPSGQTGSITSTATVAVPAGFTDPTPADNTATDVDTYNPVADMSVTKTSNNLAPLVGDNVTFTITALNNGPSDASGVKVTDLLKAGYSFVSATANKGTYVKGTGVWTIGSMVNGSSAVLTVVAKVTADIPTPGYDNAAVVSATETDPNLVNNTSTITTVPVPLIDLAINQTVSSTTPDATGNVTFTLTVNNNGPSNATGVNVADLLKPGFTFVSANPAQGTYNPTTGTWAIGNLANGGNTTMTLTVKVNNTGTTVTDYTNTAVVSATQQEVTLVNNTSAQTVSKPPTAVNDSGNTTVNVPVTINVINNDTKGSANLVPGSITIIQQPAHGTVTIDPTGKVIYTPATNYFGPDVFTYTVKDTNGAASNVATVNITITDNPKIGLAKTMIASVKQVDGSYNVTYTLTVTSYSITALNNVSITDDMSRTFVGQNIKVVSLKALGKLQVNANYNGSGTIEMLQTGNTLNPGETQQLQVVMNVMLVSPGSATYYNSANTTGTSVSGLKATDQSTDGLKPDPNVAGDISPSIPTPVELSKPNEYIPGGFSPNGDGINDKFTIENAGQRRIHLEIYNRWGNLIYKSDDYKNDWDGVVTTGVHVGDHVPDGTYYYIATFNGADKTQGFITIHR